jgi:hypothetical protein
MYLESMHRDMACLCEITPPHHPLAAALSLTELEPAAVLDGTSADERPDPAASTPQGIQHLARAVVGVVMERGVGGVALA